MLCVRLICASRWVGGAWSKQAADSSLWTGSGAICSVVRDAGERPTRRGDVQRGASPPRKRGCATARPRVSVLRAGLTR